MKKLLILLFIIITVAGLNSSAQTVYEPQMLILSPSNFIFDPSLKKEVDIKNAELKKMSEQETRAMSGKQDKANLAGNLKEMQKNSLSFLEQIDFPKQLALISQQYLIYRFYEKFPNCLILLKDEKSNGSPDNLRKIALDEHVPYVMNFSKVALYRQNGQTFCKLQMQLYEQLSNRLLIDKEYIGDWNNPGFEFTCEQGSIGCTISNALSFALPDIVLQIASNNPTLIKEKELAAKRSAFIADNIYPQPFNDALIRKIIPSTNADIDLHDLYRCFYNNDNTKFVAFFIKTIAAKDAKPLLTEKKDKNVNIITSKDIHDPGYLDQSPRTYAYIVRGVQYQNRWYFDKSEVTYFDSESLTAGKIEYLNNLQKWDFFADDTAEPGNDFWEGKLFEKIKDRRKDPDWAKYKEMWETEEREDRDYIGLYELVADEQKKEDENKNNTFRTQLITNTLLPFYNNQVKLKLNNIIKAGDPEEIAIIYPKDKHAVLNPIAITDGTGVIRIRYFVFLPQTSEVFEWVLVKPNELHKNEFKREPVLKTIGALTHWDYSFKNLDDDIFWNEKVLLKEGSAYKYLKKLQ